jgi:hypothetical protein
MFRKERAGFGYILVFVEDSDGSFIGLMRNNNNKKKCLQQTWYVVLMQPEVKL